MKSIRKIQELEDSKKELVRSISPEQIDVELEVWNKMTDDEKLESFSKKCIYNNPNPGPLSPRELENFLQALSYGEEQV